MIHTAISNEREGKQMTRRRETEQKEKTVEKTNVDFKETYVML